MEWNWEWNPKYIDTPSMPFDKFFILIVIGRTARSGQDWYQHFFENHVATEIPTQLPNGMQKRSYLCQNPRKIRI